MASATRSVDLAIRARDETQRAINSAKTALDRLRQAQAKTVARRNLLTSSKADADAAAKAYREATEASETLGRKTQGGVAGTKRQRAAFDESRRAAVQAKGAYLAAGAALSSATGRRGSFAAFDAMASGATRAEGAIDRLTAAQLRNTGATDRAAGAARRQVGAMAGQGGASAKLPLGLRPHEMTNLGYQINDLITQVASGTSPVQAIAQQGGQIAQIFPRATMMIVRMVPAIAAVTAIVGPFIAAFSRVKSVESNIRSFDAALTASADSAAYNAAELADTARALDDVGASGDEARKMVQQFVKDGLNPVFFEDFGDAARDAAKVTGEDLVEANKMLSEGLTGSYDDFKKLDQVLNVATLSERKRIRELYESGNAEEARRMAAELTFRKLDEGAAKLEGPWSRSARNFGRAWSNLLENVGNWPIIQNALDLIGRIGRKLEWLTNLMAGGIDIEANAESIGQGRARMAELDAELSQVRAQRREAQANGRGEGQLYFREQDLLRERVRVGGQVASRENELRAKATADTRLDNERNLKEDEDRALAQRPTGGGSGAADAERRAEAQADFVAGLLAENAAREFQIALIDQSERQQRIATALREAELEAQEVGLELTSAQRAEIERTTGALYDAEQAHKANQVIAQARLDLARQQGVIEDRNAFVARKLAEDAVGWTMDQKFAYGQLLAAQYDVEAATRRRAEAEKAVSDQMALRDSLMEGITFYEAQGDQGRVADLRGQLVEVNAELVTAIDNLLAFWSAFDSPEARVAVETLTRRRAEIVGTGRAAGVAVSQIEGALSQGGFAAFDRFTQRLAETKNLFLAARDAFLQFAADFLAQIGRMIAQQVILNMLKGDPAQAAISKASNFINAIVRHDGGGTSGGPYRSMPLSAFANAPRFHSGGIVGGEIPAILKRGEVVDPGDGSVFDRVFGGGKDALNFTAKFVNVLDPNDIVSRSLASDQGERIFMNFLTRNSGAVSAILRS